LRNEIAQNLWDFCHCLHLFEPDHTRALIFCFDVAQPQRGRFMHHTTFVILVVLVLGQFSVLGCAALFLWLAGEFSDPPSRRGLLQKRKNAEVTDAGAPAAPAATEMLHAVPLSPDPEAPRDDDGDSGSIDPARSDAAATQPPISVA